MQRKSVTKIELVIPLQTPAQKNSKRVAVNRRTGKTFIMSAKNVKDWQHEASEFCTGCEKVEGPVKISFEFINKDKRGRDLDNMTTSILDLLKNNNIIDDDNCFVVMEINSRFVGVDKNNPSAKIVIESIDNI